MLLTHLRDVAAQLVKQRDAVEADMVWFSPPMPLGDRAVVFAALFFQLLRMFEASHDK